MFLAIFITVFLALQCTLIFLCFNHFTYEKILKRRSFRIGAFMGVQAWCACLLLLGGYGEARWNFYSILRNSLLEPQVPRTESFEAKDDSGGLIEWVRHQQPEMPRPDFTNAITFRMWQTFLRHTLQEIFQLPDVGSFTEVQNKKMSSTIVAQNITRIFLTFESFDGTSIPAYLFIPPLPLPRPAIMVLHGHVGEHESGIVQTAGIVDSYQHKAALALASAGYVTFTMEFRGFGYLGTSADEHTIAYNALLGGSFYKAILCKDIKYGVDFLRSLDEVDPQRIGITGVSYGGEMAVTYAALDERIKVVVFQGFGGGLGVQQGMAGIKQNPLHYCHVIPGHNLYLLQEDLFFLIAPRPLLGVRGNLDDSRDSGFPETIGKAYEHLGVSSAFQFQIAQGGHEYFLQPAVQFFERYL